jgi:hypothetical protein
MPADGRWDLTRRLKGWRHEDIIFRYEELSEIDHLYGKREDNNGVEVRQMLSLRLRAMEGISS